MPDTPTPPFYPAALRPEIESLGNSGIAEVFELGLGRKDIIPLWVGEGDQPTPDFICKAAAAALEAGETFYPRKRGIPQLCEALARYTADLYGVAMTWSMTALELVEPITEAFPGRFRFIAVPNYLGEDRRYHHGPGYAKRIERFHALGVRVAKFWGAPKIVDYGAEVGDMVGQHLPVATLEHQYLVTEPLQALVTKVFEYGPSGNQIVAIRSLDTGVSLRIPAPEPSAALGLGTGAMARVCWKPSVRTNRRKLVTRSCPTSSARSVFSPMRQRTPNARCAS